MTQVIGQHFDLSPEHNKLVEKFSQSMSAEDIQLYYQIVLNGRKDLPYAADEQAAFDMLLLRMLAFTPMINQQNLPDNTENLVTDFDDVSLDVTNLSNSVNAVEPLIVEPVVVEQSVVEPLIIETSIDETLAQPSNTITEVEESNTPLAENTNFLDDDPVDVTGHIENQNTETPSFQIPTAASEQDYSSTNIDTIEQSIQNQDIYAEPIASNNPTDESLKAASPIEKALATRNMLRSRKKGLENSAKKSNDAKGRHDTDTDKVIEPTAPEKPRVDIPALESIPEQAFDVNVIDPAKIRSANQVDKWANMIDAMSLTGRLRQLAIHATVNEQSTDDLLLLNLDQATKHLNSDVAHKKLEQCISDFLNRKITVELTIVDETSHDPYQIQTHINDKRYDYAKDLLEKDEIIIGLKTHFQAELDEKTIVAL